MPFLPVKDYSDPVSRGDVDHRLGPTGAPDLTPEQQRRIHDIREGARLFARHVIASCPHSWERDMAVSEIDAASSWAAKAIARHE